MYLEAHSTALFCNMYKRSYLFTASEKNQTIKTKKSQAKSLGFKYLKSLIYCSSKKLHF